MAFRLFCVVGLVVGSLDVCGQYTVNFEGGGETKTGYASGTVSLSGIDWDMTEALIGTLAEDYKEGTRSARMRGYSSSSMTMLADKSNGLGNLTFKYRRYGTDSQVSWIVEYSTNGGSSWAQIGSSFTPTADIQTFSETVNATGGVRIRFSTGASGSSNRRANIDDIELTDYTVSCTAPTNQAHTFTSTNLQTTQMDIGWTRGNGDNILIVARQGTAVNADPVSGTSYAANAAFGSGDQIGTGNYVVYNGSGTSLTVTGLNPTTTYHYAIYEYLNTDVCYNLTELTGNATTTTPPPAITHTGTAPGSANIAQGSTNNVLYRVQVDVATTAATLTEVVASSGGSWVTGDVSNFKLWFSTDATFGGDATVATVSNPVPGGITFTVPNQAFPIGTRYLFITCDVAGAANIGNTVSAFADADGDFSYTVAPTYASSSFESANVMTIVGVPEIQLESPVNTDINCGAAALSFGSVTIGNNNSITVRIRNEGTADLNLSNLPLTLGGSHPGDYSITTQPTSPITPGDFSDMVVQFMPTTTGTRTANISISNNDSNENPCAVSFTGVGLLANDNCSGATVLTVFGSETCGGATSGTTVGATNSGVGAITCNSFTGTADDDVWYSFVATHAEHIITVIGASPLDAVVDLRSGACNGSNIACADATASGGTEVINATGLTIDDTYYVRVYGFGNGSGFGTFTICVTTPEPPQYFRSKQSGNWSDAATWEVSTDNLNWSDASAAPTIDDLDITVQHTVTISSGTVSIDQLTVAAGQMLDITGGTLSISDGPGAEDLVIFGILRNAGTVSGAGARVVKDGGVYQHNHSSLTAIPVFSWDTGAFCEVIGYGTTSGTQTGVNQSFHHFIWNCPSQTGNANLAGAMTTLGGNLEVRGTGSGSFRLTGGTTLTISIAGDLIITQGTLDLSSGSSNTIVQLNGDVDMSGGTLTESSNGSGTIEFNGTNQNYSNTGGIISNNINFIVNSGSTLDVGTSFISSSGTFTLSSGATLITANADGINSSGASGSIQTTTRNFNSGASYEFQGAAIGTFSTTPTANTVNNLTLNSSGTVNLSQALSVTGTLALTGGKLNLNGNNLTINNVSGPTWGSSTNNYIVAETGTVIRSEPTNGLFPIGTTNDYLPCRITASGIITANLSNLEAGLTDPNATLNRQWNINRTSGSGNLTTAEFQWPVTAEGTNFNSTTDKFLFRNTGGTWTNAAGPSTKSGADPYIISFANVPCCSGFSPGTESALPVEFASFHARPQQNTVLLNWRTFSEFNNDYFSIEKSTDGNRFHEIGQVSGKGTTYETTDYHFTDESPTPGINYYRLKQVDFDGGFEYSKVVSVRFEEGGKGVSVYPTIASEEVWVTFPTESTEPSTVHLFDQNGRLLNNWQVAPGQATLTIPVGHLQSGAYYLKVQTGRTVETGRFFRG